MNRPKTHTVEKCFQTRDKTWRVYLAKGTGSLPCDEEMPEGASVVVIDGKAVRS